MTQATVNLDTCDQEPIHLIGAIQPHGALVAVNATTLRIEYASTNSLDFIGFEANEILGKGLADIIGPKNAAQLPDLPSKRTTPELLKPWFLSFAGADGTLIAAECLPHRQDGHIILEFMHAAQKPAAVWEDELLRQGVMSEMVNLSDLNRLAEASARIIREVTGFDRVMIYKFAEDKHGEVIAESTDRPDSFLGLHYPASDIPEPARRHFTLNVMRAIPDINCKQVPIIGMHGDVPDAESATPLDLTFSKLRAVAPVHIEYLNNMGVAASMSISLITNDELWGLVACHHYSKRLISSSRLRFAELLGATTSTLLQSLENSNLLRKSVQAEKTSFFIEQQARAGRSLLDLIEDQAQPLMDLFDACCLVAKIGGTVLILGSKEDGSLDFAPWTDLLVDGIATTDHLSSLIPMTETQMKVAAGAAYLNLSDDGEDYIVFLRRSFDQTIRWAGKPEKVETTDATGMTRLSPRGSFALWQEERLGKSKPFNATDRDALRIVRRALFALNSVERERIALEAQKASEAEEARLRHALLDAARASSLGELASAIAHELNQPLSAIANYVSACRQELRNSNLNVSAHTEDMMQEAVQETVRAGELVRRVRDFISRGELNADYIDINEAIKQGLELALVSRDLPALNVELLLDETLPLILADPVQIGQVILNLARNSIRAMEQAQHQILTVCSEMVDDTVRITVSDTGSGIPADVQRYIFDPFHSSTTKGMGIGLSLCRSIVEAHSGRIWVVPSESGATISFEVPIHEDHDEQP